ncbi:2S globulin [Cinnamomum micranthum f. kanehirae]|uniref:2S globulin n=1 Tax=Cinnamomum micranthum f. kanehirae TaxID=337451 RepID=A0A443N383_9MAGN|nr:2S globulin [Cinnamomum micranthum f. kanehirae]
MKFINQNNQHFHHVELHIDHREQQPENWNNAKIPKHSTQPHYTANSKLFREYIGAESDSVKLTDMPINSDVKVHFILAFAIDYANGTTNGKFNVFWETNNLKPADIVSIKNKHRNVKVAVSLGGDSVDCQHKAYFKPKSISSWVDNAVSSLTQIIKQYNLDGIDVDYEHFRTGPNTFSLCIGQLISTLKSKGVISFASIAPFDDGGPVQSHYLALWEKKGRQIDYVNFQFYAYDKGIGISQFLSYFDAQVSNYNGRKVLASFISGGDGGLMGNNNLKPADIASIKNNHPNVKVAVSLGRDTVDGGRKAYFEPKSISSWVNNAVSSLTHIVKQYNLDGIDIDNENFRAGPNTFALCIGQLISTLKSNGVVTFASIAPYDDSPVQSHYLALWKTYGRQIDYVNFQFYAYDNGIGVSQFLRYFDAQASNYKGGKILASFISSGDGGLGPSNGFFF